MIDITNIQVTPIPQSIIVLQKENKIIKHILIAVAITGAIITIYNICKEIEKDNEQNHRKQY